MKKVKKTREEKREIRKFKAQERARFLEKEKKKIKKEHFYLLGAFLILILLLISLIYIMFFSKRKDLIVPDAPDYEALDVGVVDFSDKASKSDDLNSKKKNSLDVSYKIISDYYKEGILLSNTQAYYINDNFIITSGPLSDKSFISAIDKNENLKWITKLDTKDEIRSIYKVIFVNNNYYVAALEKKEAKTNLVVLKISSEGKIENTKIVKANVQLTKIYDLVELNNKLALITSEDGDIKIFYTDINLNTIDKTISLKEEYQKNYPEEVVNSLNYQTSTNIDNNLAVILSINNKFIKANVDQVYALSLVDITADITDVKITDTLRVNNYLDGFIASTNSIIYKYDTKDKLTNKFDYTTVKLEDDTAYKEQYKDDEFVDINEMENNIYIENITVNNDNILVNSKTLYSSIYDIYSKDLVIQKRIMIDSIKYDYEDGVILNSFYIDGKIYEVYSYGTETPSIMISKIG